MLQGTTAYVAGYAPGRRLKTTKERITKITEWGICVTLVPTQAFTCKLMWKTRGTIGRLSYDSGRAAGVPSATATVQLHFRLSGGSTTRNPRSSSRCSGPYRMRFAARQQAAPSAQLPPRITWRKASSASVTESAVYPA